MKRTVVLLILATVAVTANFAAVEGFSGRTGFDCTSCHNRPIQDDAVAVLEGLPVAWDAGVAYELTIRVEGGPIANPEGPQGGFEMDVSNGKLAVPTSMGGLLHTTKWGITYLPEGALMREWTVIWNAPDLEGAPFDATFWLAVVSANGNHEYRTNMSVAGEFGDSVATLQATVPPSLATLEAWVAIPLLAPIAERDGNQISGTHADGNATGIRFRLGGGDWQERETGPTWRITSEDSVEVQSTGAARVSDSLIFEGSKSTPWPTWTILLLFLARRP